MKIEEALQKLKKLELQDFRKKRKFELKESEVAYITVSKEIDKYRDIIYELINEVTIRDAELDKKDKVINMTTEDITWKELGEVLGKKIYLEFAKGVEKAFKETKFDE